MKNSKKRGGEENTDRIPDIQAAVRQGCSLGYAKRDGTERKGVGESATALSGTQQIGKIRKEKTEMDAERQGVEKWINLYD